MGWLNFLERRFGRYAIPELTWKLIGLQVAVYIFGIFFPEFYGALFLDPTRVLQGEIWRLISYIFIPPAFGAGDVIYMFFYAYFFLLIGGSLEHEWGAFRYNMFWLIGMLGTTFFAFFAVGGSISNIYLMMSLFLAFATLFPDYVIYVFLILPVRVKYLAYLDAVMLLILFVGGDWSTKVGVLVAFANYLLFFGPTFWQLARVRFETEGRRKQFRQAKREQSGDSAFHECAVCSRTDVTNPELEFRVGADGHEYCMEHLKK
jgi:hypothetical protein